MQNSLVKTRQIKKVSPSKIIKKVKEVKAPKAAKEIKKAEIKEAKKSNNPKTGIASLSGVYAALSLASAGLFASKRK